MDKSTDEHTTDKRIIDAFLRLASEHGLDGASTRRIAEVAGVNPVTLFRRFGTKSRLAVAALRLYSPVQELTAREPDFEIHDVCDGIVENLMYLRATILDRRRTPWLRSGIRQLSQLSEVRDELTAVRKSFYDFLRKVLARANPALRAEVDHHVTALQLLGLIRIVHQLDDFGNGEDPDDREWRALFAAAVRPLLREG